MRFGIVLLFKNVAPDGSFDSEMSRIPRPWPDAESKMPEHHYRDVFSSPIVDDTGKPRASDDWQPCHQIKQMFESGALKPDD